METTDDVSIEKHYLVTGGSSGIGAAICQQLLTTGCYVTTISRRRPKDVDDWQSHWHAVQCDVSNLASLSDSLKSIKQGPRPLDGVIIAHGVGQFGSIEEFSEADIENLVNTNFLSSAMIARAVIPLLRKQESSDLLFIGSEAAIKAGKKGAIYSATKFALRGLAQALRFECQTSGVRVSIVNPGMVDTAFFDNLNFAPGEHSDNVITAKTVAEAVMHILAAPANAVFDEMSVSPLKSVIRNKEPN